MLAGMKVRDVLKLLKADGWYRVPAKGGHRQFKHPTKPGKVTVLCHSLGAITWMHYCTALDRQVADRVLLVAPPYVSHDIPPADTPPGIDGFFPPPLDPEAIRRAARETAIICGENDCYGTEDQIKAYADRLQLPMHMLPGAGHVSPYWGYGSWPWVLDWCLRRAELPPQPRL